MNDPEDNKDTIESNIPEKKEPARGRERNLGPLFLMLMLVILIPLGVKFYSSYLNKKLDYDKKVEEERQLQFYLERESKQLKRMKERQTYLKTDEGVEQQARDKLGLTRPNEIAFVVVPTPASAKSNDETTSGDKSKDKKKDKQKDKDKKEKKDENKP